ncbi:sucrose synthase 2 [Tanacetum coccineum]
MRERFEDILSAHRNEIVSLLSRYVAQGKAILQPHQILSEIDNIIGDGVSRQKLTDGPFGEVLRTSQECIVLPPFVTVAVRPRPGVWEYVRVDANQLSVEQLTASEYLVFKEELVGQCKSNYVLELDFEPFNASFPRPNRSSSIGNGVQFLNRHLSSNMFRSKDCMEPLLDFLRMHKHDGHLMMLNDRINSMARLQSSLTKAEDYLSKLPSDAAYSELQGLGFERGWGNNAERVLEMLHLLSDILQAPDPSILETFLARIPMVFNVVILSIHGYFGQANVLGLPDTGGQDYVVSTTSICACGCVIDANLYLNYVDNVTGHMMMLPFVLATDCIYTGSSPCLGE